MESFLLPLDNRTMTWTARERVEKNISWKMKQEEPK